MACQLQRYWDIYTQQMALLICLLTLFIPIWSTPALAQVGDGYDISWCSSITLPQSLSWRQLDHSCLDQSPLPETFSLAFKRHPLSSGVAWWMIRQDKIDLHRELYSYSHNNSEMSLRYAYNLSQRAIAHANYHYTTGRQVATGERIGRDLSDRLNNAVGIGFTYRMNPNDLLKFDATNQFDALKDENRSSFTYQRQEGTVSYDRRLTNIFSLNIKGTLRKNRYATKNVDTSYRGRRDRIIIGGVGLNAILAHATTLGLVAENVRSQSNMPLTETDDKRLVLNLNANY
jgi:hypothetical protein